MLESLGIEFEVVTPEVGELREGDPAEVVLENARRKARAGLNQVGGGDLVVLGVDTDVALEGRLLGKAGNEEEARDRLVALSGRTHEVLSGMVLLGVDERGGVARSEVTFHPLDEATIDLYLRSGEWRGRAGAYAIQGLGSILVAQLRGDFANVVGLPLALLLELAPKLIAGRDNAIFFGSADGYVYAFSEISGRLLWRRRTGAAVQAVVLTDNGIIATSLDNFVYLLSPRRGELLWKRQLAGRIAALPLTDAQSALFAPLGGDAAVVLSLRDGKQVNTLAVGEDGNTPATSLLVGNLLLIPTRHGLMAFAPSSPASN